MDISAAYESLKTFTLLNFCIDSESVQPFIELVADERGERGSFMSNYLMVYF